MEDEGELIDFLKYNIRMKIYRIAKTFPPSLTSDQMIDFIMDNNLKSWGGKLDLNDAKDIARYSDKWELKEVSLSNFDWIMEPIRNKRFIPPIIGHSKDEGYEVLDGMHRIGEARYRGETSILAYVGESFGDSEEYKKQEAERIKTLEQRDADHAPFLPGSSFHVQQKP